MTTRPSRTMSIPVPASSRTTLPHLDDVMSMPFTASPPPLPRPRLSSSPHSSSPLPGLSASASALASSSYSYSSLRNSPSRPYGLAHHHHPRQAQTGPVQPRVVGRHASSWTAAAAATTAPSASSSDGVACSPSSASASISPASPRARRPSSSTISGGPASLSLRPPTVHPTRVNAHWHPHAPSNAPPQPPHQLPQPFPRPAYLDHSLLRDLLQTELPLNGNNSNNISFAPPPPPPQPQPQQSVHRTPSVTLRTPSPDSEDDERSPSPVPPPHLRPTARAQSSQQSQQQVATMMVGSTPVFRIPTRWSEQDRHQCVNVSASGLELSYTGIGIGNAQSTDAGLARANYPIPSACGIYYFEVEVLSKNPKAQVSVGFTTGNARYSKLPGWEKESWGYYGDDGQAYTVPADKETKVCQPFGQPFGAKDTIGAGIDFSQNRAFFTKNGTLIGTAFDLSPALSPTSTSTTPAQPAQLYPSVGLRHVGDHVRANFGHAPFRFDIDEHAQGARDAVWTNVQRAPVDWKRVGASSSSSSSVTNPAAPPASASTTAGSSEDGRAELGRLVLGYLTHHGYAQSAQALSSQLARESHAPAPETPPTAPTEYRLAVLRAVLEGDIDTALEVAQVRFPDVLEARGGRVRLALRCRKFVELVNGAAAVKRRVDARANASASAGASGTDVDGMDVDGEADFKEDEKEGGEDKTEAESALKRAIAYGQQLRAEYRKDPRREVQDALERAFAVVLYHFPSESEGEVGRWAGREGREALAGEVNEAILESQGFPRRPALERVYRQAVACTVQLGYQGVGAGVYADVRRELLDG